MTWRSLYACSNGWRGLRPGCFETLELPSSGTSESSFFTACLVDGRGLGWAAAAADASELLVVASGMRVLVPRNTPLDFRLLPQPELRLADQPPLPQVFNCRGGQLLQRGNLPPKALGRLGNRIAPQYTSAAALPAGRVAAGSTLGIDVLDLELAGSESAPPVCLPTSAAKTKLADACALDGCARTPCDGQV